MEQKNSIEDLIQISLNAIALDDSAYQISNQILGLCKMLEDYELLNYVIESDEIVSSQKISISEDDLYSLKEIAKIIDTIFGTKHALLSNVHTSERGFIFVGMPNHVKTSDLVFRKFIQIHEEVKSKFVSSLNKGMKQSDKEDEISEFMDDWVEEFTSMIEPSPFLTEESKELSSYLSKKYKSYDDLVEAQAIFAKIAKAMLENGESTIKDVYEKLYEAHGKDVIDNAVSLILSLKDQDQDFIIDFSNENIFGIDDES